MTPDSPLAGRFIQARKFTKGPRTKGAVSLVVIHATASREVEHGALNNALWFANPQTRDASANYVCDDAETIQCVREADVAWGAKGVNRRAVHIEQVGQATQTAEQWADTYSAKVWRRAAALTADICKRNRIPAVWLSVADLQAGKAGVTDHNTVSHAFPGSGHTDPGPGWPRTLFMGAVAEHMKLA